MAHKLAEELLAEILSLSMHVDDKLFASTYSVSPFRRAEQSSAYILRVCKRWRRVGNPFLYRTVVVRSAAQARGLALVLKRNPQFGLYIKKLRVEGAYAGLAQQSAGLLSLFSTIDPVRVILTTMSRENISNKQKNLVWDGAHKALREWRNLRSFQFYYHDEYLDGRLWANTPSNDSLAHALAASTSLRAVHVFTRSLTESTAVMLASLPHITIYIHYRGWDFHRRIKQDFAVPAHLVDKFVFIQDDERPPRNQDLAGLPANRAYSPMSNADEETRVKMWTRILEIALTENTECSFFGAWFDIKRCDAAVAACLMRVSRLFFRMAVSVLWQYIDVWKYNLEQLRWHEERFNLQCHDIKSLKLRHGFLDRNLICSVTNLVSCEMPLDPDSIIELGNAAGGTLRRLCLVIGYRHPKNRVSISFRVSTLSLFTGLTHLRWDTHQGDIAPDPLSLANDTQAILARLRELVIVNEDASVLTLLAPLSLPNLEKLDASCITATGASALKKFMERHGTKLKFFGAAIQVDPISDSLRPSLKLETLCLKCVVVEKLAHRANFSKSWIEGFPTVQQLKLGLSSSSARDDPFHHFLPQVTRATFPALRTIFVDLGLYNVLWPDSENEKKFKIIPWLRIAAHLQTEGITLQVMDSRGQQWRP